MTQPARRRGFLASLQAAMAPMPPEDDDDTGPLPVPKTVTIATVLSILGGLLFLYQGVGGLTLLSRLVSQSKDGYNTDVKGCINDVGGIGTAVTGTAPADKVSYCKSLPTMDAAAWDSYRSTLTVLFVAFTIIGIASVAAGWFLRRGARWARRVLIAVTVVTVIAAMLLRISGPLSLAGTVGVLAAVVLCYIGSGGLYFTRMHTRKKA